MPDRQPTLSDTDAYLQALRDPAQNLLGRYREDPEGLALFLGLKLPEKPLQVMKQLGVYDAVRHGPITPGLRELVLDVCNLDVLSAVGVGPRGGGKGTSLATPIPTPGGWTTMGDVSVGDLVFSASGVATPVVWKSEEFYEDTYDVIFDDGSSVTVGQNHEWDTLTANQRRRIADRSRRPSKGLRSEANNRGSSLEAQSVITEDVLATIHDRAEKRKPSPNHTIDNCNPLQMPDTLLATDPYTFGLWLGDGGRGTEVIGADAEDAKFYVGWFEQNGYSVQERIRKGQGRPFNVMTIKGLKKNLALVGALTKKHIPPVYMRASAAQRLALIQGLMDTDGTTRSTNNNCQFAQKDDELVMQFAELVASMGWKYTIAIKQAVCQTGARYKHLLCSFNPDQQVYRLPRKAARLNLEAGQRDRLRRRYIVDVVPVDREPLQCIQVAHPSHLYLVGESMIPTHNSQGVSFIEFFLWMLRDFDALNLGGSELQAANVYHYLLGYIDSNPEFDQEIKGDPKISETEKLNKAWIRVLAASTKSVRSPHAGGIRQVNGQMVERGGLLVCDEEAEADEGIVDAAMYTINTARPSVSVRTSTFHNAEGSFGEVVENHEEMGYTLYQWDVFDVAEPCACTGGVCASAEKCFRDDHYETVENPDTGAVERNLVHKAYCGGRAQYAQGWVPMREIEATWKRGKRNHANFEVEAMGSRPKSQGYVIKDLTRFEANRPEASGRELYVAGSPVTITVDWGAVNAALEVWQKQFDVATGERHVLLHADPLEEAGVTTVIGSILRYWTMYPEAEEVRADIGGGGGYLNPLLRNEHGIPCEDVNFAEMKEASVAVWNLLNEAGAAIYPEEHHEFRRQVRKWKRKQGRIQKGDDHLCDAAICYFSKYIEDFGMQGVRIAPRAFNAISHLEPAGPVLASAASHRVPVARGFSRG